MIWNYKWKKEKPRGIAGVYECDGWTVWSNGDYWKITNPNGFTYARGYKIAGSAMHEAERRIKATAEKSLLAPVYGAEYVRQLNEKKGE